MVNTGMFKTYRFKTLQTGDVVKIVKLSYLWACLFGPVFVVLKAGFAAVAFNRYS